MWLGCVDCHQVLIKSTLDSRNGGNGLLDSERRFSLFAVVLLNKRPMEAHQRVRQNIPATSWPTKKWTKTLLCEWLLTVLMVVCQPEIFHFCFDWCWGWIKGEEHIFLYLVLFKSRIFHLGWKAKPSKGIACCKGLFILEHISSHQRGLLRDEKNLKYFTKLQSKDF